MSSRRVRPGGARRTATAAVAVLALSGAAACTGLPTAGPVVREPEVGTSVSDTSSFYTPPGPAPGDTRRGIVGGFLLAMQATPVSVAVAQEFLTDDAVDTWRPERRTLVYDGSPVSESDDGIALVLGGAIGLDARGRWLGPQDLEPTELELVREQGEWRIANPPNALLISASHFADRYTRAAIGFFDPSARTLVPEPVHFPLGPQGATALVRALLRGPLVPQAERSFAPDGTTVDLSVSVSSDGLVEVPVSAQVLNLSSRELERFAVQLSYTLAQVGGVSRIQLTTGGAPVATGTAGNAIPIDLAGTLAPTYAAAAGDLFGVRDGRLVRIVDNALREAGEPWTATPSSVREAAVSLDGTVAAGVSSDGRRLLLAPLLPLSDEERRGEDGGEGDGAGDDSGAGEDAASSTRVGVTLQPVAAGRDLRELNWTRFGELWSLATSRDGAVIRVRTSDGRTEVVDVPGVSGEQVTSLLLSRDGSRLVAAVRGERRGERLVVSRVARDEVGGLRQVLPARPLPLLQGLLADGTTDVLDVAWTSATELALLTRSRGGLVEVERAAIDGSPVADDVLSLAVPPEGARTLVASPDPESGIRLLTAQGEVFQLATSGSWVRLPVPLLDDHTWVG
ncbi:GerMN domain-containing protein [Nocardioidaceae bacterium]|nr:GerMN domain-containing protein [Nocardioidaceae bacterium]